MAAPAAPTRTRSSRHELEPNPFEQSFRPSKGEPGAPQHQSQQQQQQSGSTTSPPRGQRGPLTRTRSSTRNAAASSSSTSNSGSGAEAGSGKNGGGAGSGGAEGGGDSKKVGGNGKQPATPANGLAGAKGSLPGVASLTSPSESSNPFSWVTGSLRSGPLSPAMLGGPSASGQGFDANAFRTGFTPDLSNYKTGLTPLGTAGLSFPPPSPNTAAFLATIGGASAPGSAAPITPNTLAALTGNAAGLADTTAPHGLAGAAGTQAAFNSNARGEMVAQPFDYAFSRSMTDKPTSRLRSSTGNDEDGLNQSVSPELINNKPLAMNNNGANGVVQMKGGAGAAGGAQNQSNARSAVGHRPDGSLMQPPRQPASATMPNGAGGAPGGDHNAAYGLSLLSQHAHQLSKRNEHDPAAHAAAAALTGLPRQVPPPPHNAQGQMGMYGGMPQPPQQQQQQQQAQKKAGAAGPAAKGAAKRKKSAKDEPEESEAKRNGSTPASAASPPKAGGKKGGAAAAKKAKGNDGAALGNSTAANTSGMSAGSPGDSGDESDNGGSQGGDMDDEEKRKNFLERNRQAALKCRQRKKAWLQSLQAKVEYLQQDNDGLQATIQALRNEVMYLKAQLMHGGAGNGATGGPPPPMLVPHGMPHPMSQGPGGPPVSAAASIPGSMAMSSSAGLDPLLTGAGGKSGGPTAGMGPGVGVTASRG